MRVYRIEREKHLDTTLEGVGAASTEGFRWNSLNTFLVYTAASRALALLEVAVHLDLSQDLPNDRFYVEIDIPDEVNILELHTEDLPIQWNASPPILETRFIGDDFVKGMSAAVLKVPSSIVPLEHNYLINPRHPEAGSISVVSVIPVEFDERLGLQ